MGRFHEAWRRAAVIVAGIAALTWGTVGPAQAAGPTAGAVAAGYSHTCTIRTDATLWCWGGNDSGQLGDGTTTGRTTPVRVGADTWTSIDAGTSYTCGVRTDRTLWCWGSNRW